MSKLPSIQPNSAPVATSIGNAESTSSKAVAELVANYERTDGASTAERPRQLPDERGRSTTTPLPPPIVLTPHDSSPPESSPPSRPQSNQLVEAVDQDIESSIYDKHVRSQSLLQRALFTTSSISTATNTTHQNDHSNAPPSPIHQPKTNLTAQYNESENILRESSSAGKFQTPVFPPPAVSAPSSAASLPAEQIAQMSSTFMSWSDHHRDQFLQSILYSLRLSQVHILTTHLMPHVLPHLSQKVLAQVKELKPQITMTTTPSIGGSALSLARHHPHNRDHTSISLTSLTGPKPNVSSLNARDIIDLIIVNRTDILKWLPTELSLKILSYLDPKSLSRCGQVNRTWRALSGYELLWKPLFLDNRWSWGVTEQTVLHVEQQIAEVRAAVEARARRRPDIDIDSVMAMAVGRVWKYWFRDRYRIRRNWERGVYSLRMFAGHGEMVACLQFNDQYLVSGSSDNTLKLWAMRTNTHPLLTLSGHAGTVRCVALDGDKIISGSNDMTVRVWDIGVGSADYGKCIGTLTGHHAPVRCLQNMRLPSHWTVSEDEQPVFSDDDADMTGVERDLLISGSYDCTIKLFLLAVRPARPKRTAHQRLAHNCLRTLSGHTGPVLCLQFEMGDRRADGGLSAKLVSGSADCSIRLWNPETGECLRVFTGHLDAVSCLQFDQYKIISGSLDSCLRRWNLETGACEEVTDWVHNEGHTGVVRNLRFDKNVLVSSSDDRTLKVWLITPTGLHRMLTLKQHTDGVTCLQFDYKRIVSGSYDKSVRIWDFSSP